MIKDKILIVSEHEPLGANAEKIFKHLAFQFGWDETLSEYFKFGKSMSIKNVFKMDDKKYGVQFITYNNFNRQDKNNGWKNYINGDCEFIMQHDGPFRGFYNKNRRLLFVKESDDRYYFYGVYGTDEYDCVILENNIFKKTYHRISDKFPL